MTDSQADLSSTGSSAPISVLCVDDEPNILSALKRVLRAQGYRVLTAESGQAGLAALSAGPVDIVISDMRMPQMDGAHFLEQVRLQHPASMRLLLTGYADVSSTADAVNRGEIFRYINKPWDDKDLLQTLHEALERRDLMAENARLLALAQQQNEALNQLHASLEKKVQERTQELEQANSVLSTVHQQLEHKFLVSIKTFTGLVELRGGSLGGHSRRVADGSRRVAQAWGLDERNCNDIHLAGLLHDIGKIGLSDALIRRPVSGMSGTQLAEYCRHASDGEAALLPLEELRDAARLIRTHHEQFDGHGFPDGLKGEEIPLGSRILAVVNDYDGYQIGTLTGQAMKAPEALRMLQVGAGKRYDARVVELFVQMVTQNRLGPQGEKQVGPQDVQPGMVLARDFVDDNGALLLAADTRLTPEIVDQLLKLVARRGQELSLPVREVDQEPS